MKLTFLKTFFFAICLIANISAFGSNEGAYIVRNFDPNDYDGGSKIYTIATTSNGLIYLGDKNGIIEYDGENWIKIRTNFPIHSLAVDNNNNIFVAGEEGIGQLKRDSLNQIKYHSLNHLINGQQNSNSYKNSEVFHINDEILFVAENKLIIYSENRIRIIENNYKYNIVQKINNHLYLYAQKSGLYKYTNGKLEAILTGEHNTNRGIWGFIESNKGLIVFENSSCFLATNNTLSPIDTHLNKIVERYITEGIEQISDNTYALKTYYKGLLLVNKDLKIIKYINQNSNLINNTVFATEKDNYGNLWVGTSAGISVFRQNLPFTVYNTRSGIGTGYSASIINNEIFLGTSQGLWKRRNIASGNKQFEPILDGHIFGLSKVDDILYAGHPSGVYAYTNNIARPIVHKISSGKIKKIPFSADQYISSSKEGLLLFSKAKDAKLISYSGFIDGKNSVNHNIEFDTLKNVWVEYNKGVYNFNWENTDKKSYYSRVSSENRLKKVINIKNQLFFVADSGVYSFNYKDETFYKAEAFESFSKKNGIASNIICDNMGKIWYFTNRKLIPCKWGNDQLIEDKKYYSRYIDDSFPAGYENIYSIDDTTSLIGSEQGFFLYKDREHITGTYSSVIIRNVHLSSNINGKKRIWGSVSNNLNTYNLDIESPIAYTNNSISFNYSAGSPNYKSVAYQTFLRGYNTKWSEWNTVNNKEFTNLPPGSYRFIVRALNEFDEFSNIAICNFTILPPWYLTTYAKIGYVVLFILVLGLIILIVRYSTKRAHLKALEKEKAEQKKAEQKKLQKKLVTEKDMAVSKNEKLLTDNLHKSKELANLTLNLIQKDQTLNEFKDELDRIKNLSESNKLVTSDIRSLLRRLNNDVESENNWEAFGSYFDTVHESFFIKLKKKFPELTPKDLRLCAYLRMNLSTKEISPLMNISIRGVEIGRYRLRKKLDLDRNVNISTYLNKA